MFNFKKIIAAYCIFQMAASFAQAQESSVTLDNGVIRREISLANNHVGTKSFVLSASNTQFVAGLSPDFSVKLDDTFYSGQSEWSRIRSRDTTDATGGSGVIITLEQAEKQFSVELVYLVYPKLPVIYKTLRVINNGTHDLKVEAIDVENFRVNWSNSDTPTYTWTLRQYARYKHLGPYIGNWDDPLVIVHNHVKECGIAIGNEAIGVMKRTAVFPDGFSVSAGLTHPEQSFGFRKWLRAGEQYTAPWVFIALYDKCKDGSIALNTIVPDFVRRHANIRINQLPQKPMFVYNTWIPFTKNINEQLVRELAQAAAECGVEEFVIDDGWQIANGNWEVNRQKFPNGLRPVFDYIKSLGMKPGLWVTLAWSNDVGEHPEWFVKDKNGQLINLHIAGSQGKTACMSTEWYDYIRDIILRLVDEHGLAYIKLDLAIVTSAYMYNDENTGCYATDHPLHRDHAESFEIMYRRCMQLFDELHQKAPDLFIDCTYETAGKLNLMDYGIAKHAEGNWLSNVDQTNPTGPLRVRNLAWGRSPALPATSLVIGNLLMNGQYHQLNYKSLTGSLPIMLGDPRQLTKEERQWYKTWSGWLKELEKRHGFMSFRQDLPGFGEPMEGFWDGFCRLNTETGSGGLVGIFRQGSTEETRMVTVPWLNFNKTYQVKQGITGKILATLTGKELAEKGFTVKLNKKYDGELFEIVSL